MNNIESSVVGAFIGDSFSLPAHWNYNPTKIKRLYGRITNIAPLEENKYHTTRESGDFTHYGDQMLWLLEYVSRNGSFDAESFALYWSESMLDFDGYMDSATKNTLENHRAGKRAPSSSNDLAGASRMAPLLLAANLKDENDLAEAARQQTAITHGDAQVVDAAEFFMRVLVRVLAGEELMGALRTVAKRDFAALPAVEWIRKADALMDVDTTAAIGILGQTCHVDHAFPATVYLLKKYAHSFEEAQIENVMAGGDSAARGILVGMILAAIHGRARIPEQWISATRLMPQIVQSIDACLPVHRLGTLKFGFQNRDGIRLSGRLETPDQKPIAVALFAHCFTCSKDIAAASRVTRELADLGFAVLRFDFTGLGNSDGDFSNTDFSANIEDLLDAAAAVESELEQPVELLVGHSLGGAAVLAVAAQISTVKGVATIGAPSEPAHVVHLFEEALPTLERDGVGEVELAGRRFQFRQSFVDDLTGHKSEEVLESLSTPALILHAPEDQTVDVDHARFLQQHLRGPASLVYLEGADHLLTKTRHAQFAAKMIALWAQQHLT